ncbi:MAG: DUF1343 domain-containing protein [bacterium]|jgi:uncharacterized protein YbbC (DUF1343 family)|nr:DUF1343 domain-containing protein [candidate division KSB1 bacterium]MDH7561563.1 DUF1343 domain-containing protein [bacterium]
MLARFCSWWLLVLGALSCTPAREPAPAPVESGLDVLVASDCSLLKGKRVGVITNHTGIDRQGRHIADLLHEAAGVTLSKLFAPEHGIRGTAEAGAQIGAEVDAKTGVPILSLYGETKKPTPEMLSDLDVLVFDIQDVGTRFYTYISTMSLAMEAAAEQQIPFVVLDRPNPIGGVIVEGPVLAPENRSFVGIHPIALRHGMTVGELARLFNEEGWLAGGKKAELTVVRMRNWRRHMLFADTGLPWVKPSPNIVSPTTAQLYPGIGLLEATNVAEGRGTQAPFENIGAPWIDTAKLLQALQPHSFPGLAFASTSFVPVDLPGMATNPKYEGQLCKGLRLRVTRPESLRAVDVGIHLIAALRDLHQDKLTIREPGMRLMTGSTPVTTALLRGDAPEAIIASWSQELQAFLSLRQKYLLYD